VKSGLHIEGLSHQYGNKQALRSVGFSVEEGGFCALLGPNGAGKSTLFSLLCRLYAAQSGTIKIAGLDLANKPREALGKMGIVFQQPTLDLDLSVKQNLIYFAGLHGLSGAVAAKNIHSALDRLRMGERANEKVRALNGGHRRRMEIARALIHAPKVLLLDEPTVGLDAKTRREITEHVHQLAAQERLTVLWATHLVDEVWPDDQLVILHQGEIIADGVARKITGRKTLGKKFAELTEGEDA